jgi:hypothetical protein
VDLLGALRAMDDDQLAELLSRRPDLADPPPADFETLAERAAWPGSLERCLAGLDRFATQLVEALCLLPDGADIGSLCELVGVPDACDAADVEDGVGRLAGLALVWPGPSGRLWIPAKLRHGLRYPARLGRPLAEHASSFQKAALERTLRAFGLPSQGKKGELIERLAAAMRDPARLGALVAGAPDGTAALLADLNERGPRLRLPGGFPYSSYGRQAPDPVKWLHDRLLIVRLAWDEAEMPREVGLGLRGCRAFTQVHARCPETRLAPLDPSVDVAGTAAQAAAGTLRAVEAILTNWGETPPTVLKDGGVGVRDVKRAAKTAEVDEADAAVLVELSLAGRLLGVEARTDAVLPTGAFDAWLDDDAGGRWLALAGGWLAAERYPSLAGKRSTKDKAIPPLSPGVAWETARPQRDAVAAALRGLEDAAVPGAASLATTLEWRAPRLWARGPAPQPVLVAWTLAEAALLGVTGAGALSPWGRLLLEGRLDEARAAFAGTFSTGPAELTLQADLTALAAGPLPPGLAAELDLMADVESRGAATVWRFSPASVRRALDAGRTAAEITAFLATHAKKGVPQPLEYLVADTGRRHGGIRVGVVGAYVRSDDPALVAELCGVKTLARLGLRALAPTVAVAAAPAAEVLAGLRKAGYLPAEEDATGAMLVQRPPCRRLAPAPCPPAFARPLESDHVRPTPPGELAAVVAGLRAAPSRTPAPAPAPAPRLEPVMRQLQALPLFDPPGSATAGGDCGGEGEPRFAEEPEEMVALLLDAEQEGFPVALGMVNPSHRLNEEAVRVRSVGGSGVVVEVLATGAEVSLTLDRVAWVEEVDDADIADFVAFAR